MVARHRGVTSGLGLLRAFSELDRAFTYIGLRAVACGGLLPGIDLLAHRRLDRVATGSRQFGRHPLGSREHGGPTDALGLKESPQVGGLHVVADRAGLRALSQGLRKCETQRQNGDDERDLLVPAVQGDRLFVATTAAMLVSSRCSTSCLTACTPWLMISPPCPVARSGETRADAPSSASGGVRIKSDGAAFRRGRSIEMEPFARAAASDTLRRSGVAQGRKAVRPAGACCDRLRATDRCRLPCRPAWSRGRRVPATPGSRADRRHAQADVWRRNDGAHGAWRCPEARVHPQPSHGELNDARREWTAVGADEQPAASRKLVGTARDVVRDQLRHLRQDRHHARLATLAGYGDEIGATSSRQVFECADRAPRISASPTRTAERERLRRERGSMVRGSPRRAGRSRPPVWRPKWRAVSAASRQAWARAPRRVRRLFPCHCARDSAQTSAPRPACASASGCQFPRFVAPP